MATWELTEDIQREYVSLYSARIGPRRNLGLPKLATRGLKDVFNTIHEICEATKRPCPSIRAVDRNGEGLLRTGWGEGISLDIDYTGEYLRICGRDIGQPPEEDLWETENVAQVITWLRKQG